jgi:hypothetical protein
VAPGGKGSQKTTAAPAKPATDRVGVAIACIAAWLVPGAGHLRLGRRGKGLVFLIALPAMFGIGLYLGGRLFPFVWSEPLVGLAAVADLGVGLWYVAAKLAGCGGGQVVAVTYEYGNTFLIVAGLLNFLVMLDVFDIGLGRK